MAQSHVDEAVDLEAEQSEPSTSTHGSSASTKANQRPAVRQANFGKAFLNIQHEDRSSIHTGMDCNDTAFDLDFQGNVAQQALPNIDFGTSTERFDVNDVLEGM